MGAIYGTRNPVRALGIIPYMLGTHDNGERNIKIDASSLEVSQIFPHFVIKSTERKVMSHSVFTKCGES
jgi:hypothetical protein